MSETPEIACCEPAAGPLSPARPGGLCLLLLLALYAAGLTHGLARPWTGMHDWNGAFYSELARNLLRYPMSVNHGMGVVAVGPVVPPPQERSVYATHPPGLVWLVALAFRLLGEAEWTARLVPLLASLGSLALMVRIVKRAWGLETALLAGLLYAVMPMAVFFGRMVDQEAVGLFCMLGTLAAWQVLVAEGASNGPRGSARAAWIAAILGAIWIDWSGVLFAGLFCAQAIVQRSRKRISGSLAAMVILVAMVGTAGMLVYLVYAGLEGRWSDLIAILKSRAAEVEGVAMRKDPSAPGGSWRYTLENLTWPMLLLAAAGAFQCLARRHHQAHEAPPQECPQVQKDSAAALWVLPVTGALWLGLFWRQYERHNYWLFYLGPPAALFAAQALLALRERFMARGARWASAVMYAVSGVVLAVAFRGADEYFARVSFPAEAVAALQQINRQTQPGDRVLLYSSPVLEEQRGGYRFRNLVPPQVPYYLDRAFDVEQDPSAVAREKSKYAVYVMPVKAAIEQAARVADLQARFASGVVGPYVVFDLRSGRP